VLSSVLVAKPGEIARRIIRACRSLGIRSVAVYSEADRAWHSSPRPMRPCHRPRPAARELSRHRAHPRCRPARPSRAIHPGYGFLSENWRFAQACAHAGFTFVGPSWQVIQQMGDKVGARRLMAAAGVPVVPGSEGTVDTLEAARDAARRIGYPIILKGRGRRRRHRHGGGRRGGCPRRRLRIGPAPAQSAFDRAPSSSSGFSRRRAMWRCRCSGMRTARSCTCTSGSARSSAATRSLIEESPAPNLPATVKARLTEAAVAGGKAVGYVNAGTMEFVVAGVEFYFLEMNTRLQVEHPVTEEVTGLDLVQAQLRVAAGEPLQWKQDEIRQRGWSIECRNLRRGSGQGLPALSRTAGAADAPGGPRDPPGVRVAEGVEVSVHYDPLLAKLVASGATARRPSPD